MRFSLQLFYLLDQQFIHVSPMICYHFILRNATFIIISSFMVSEYVRMTYTCPSVCGDFRSRHVSLLITHATTFTNHTRKCCVEVLISCFHDFYMKYESVLMRGLSTRRLGDIFRCKRCKCKEILRFTDQVNQW